MDGGRERREKMIEICERRGEREREINRLRTLRVGVCVCYVTCRIRVSGFAFYCFFIIIMLIFLPFY